MAEGLPTELLVLIFRHLSCRDLPATRLVCKQWYHACVHYVQCPEQKTASQHALEILLNDRPATRADLAHVAANGCETMEPEWRMELCFVPHVTVRMLRAFICPAIVNQVFSRACEAGAIQVATVALSMCKPPGPGQTHLSMACLLAQRHRHAAILDSILQKHWSTVQWANLLTWCVQNHLDVVVTHLLRCNYPFSASAITEAFTQAVTLGNIDIVNALWSRATAIITNDHVKHMIAHGWTNLLSSAVYVSSQHLVYAAARASLTTLVHLWQLPSPLADGQRPPYLGNAAFIAAITAQQWENARYLLDHVVPLAFERKRADVFFICALAGQWEMLQILLQRPGTRPCTSRKVGDRLFRTILFTSAARQLGSGSGDDAYKKRVIQRLFELGVAPPVDTRGKLVQIAQCATEIRPSLRRVLCSI